MSKGSPAEVTALNKAVLAIKQLQRKLEACERQDREPIAVIGLACRFPGGSSAEAFWESLLRGTDAVREVPASRWSKDRSAAFGIVPWGGFIDEVEAFDAEFFGISPREARALDPQQRLLLEVAWEALEGSGTVPSTLRGTATGVFVGISNFDYQHKFTGVSADARDAYFATGNVASVSAGRLSYVLGLQGPCFALDTACSSSLVAVHEACQSLRAKESNLALAGGVNLLLSEYTAASVTRTQAISPDGRCKTFDASANGYVRGEGCGVLVLKRLSEALRDGDGIRAIIRGSAINHDGASAGLTVPNGLSQREVICRALERARVAPEQVSYIETHGTGTALGDPIEVESLTAVYGKPRPEGRGCWLGAVKTNIGHLESAAGVAGLIKAILAIEHRSIPPNLHFRRLNPKMSLAGTPFALPTEVQPWETDGATRLAAVSSFGFSGTNGHVLLSSAPASDAIAPQSPGAKALSHHLVTLSAKDPAALLQQARNLLEHLNAHPELPLSDVAFSLATSRTHFRNRLAFVAATRSGLQERLESYLSSPQTAQVLRSSSSRVPQGRIAFLFEGAVGTFTDEDVRDLVEQIPSLGTVPTTTPNGDQLALQLSLCALFSTCGVHPDVVLGQGLGEIAALCAAAVFSLAEGTRLLRALTPRAGERTVDPSEVREIARSIRFDNPQIALGGRLAAAAHADYWSSRPSSAIEPADSAGTLKREAITLCIGLGQGFPISGADGDREGAAIPSLLHVLGHAWVRGLSIAWQSLYPPDRYHRIALPTYPFQRRRHWFEPAEHEKLEEGEAVASAEDSIEALFQVPAARALATLSSRAHLDAGATESLTAVLRALSAHRDWERYGVQAGGLLYDLGWTQQSEGLVRDPDVRGAWILLMDRDGLAERLVTRLESAGGTCFQVWTDGGEVPNKDRCYSVKEDSLEALVALFRDLMRGVAEMPSSSAFRGIVCLWGSSPKSPWESRLAQGLLPDLGAILHAVQAIATTCLQQFPPLWMIVRGTVCVEAGDTVENLDKAMLWGLGRVFEQEHPESWGGIVDIDRNPGPDALNSMIAMLATPSQERYLAIRGDRIWAQRLRRHTPTAHAIPPRFWAGSHLITGGTGGLGLQLAEWLARRGVPHLVLTSRRGLAGPGAQKIATRIERSGVRVTVAQADTCDREAMARVIESIEAQGPPLRGVFHCAGIADFNVLINQTADQFQRVLSPKVLGAWTLHELTRDLDLDAFVLYSSIASVLCAAGQGAYATANSFLDTLSLYRHQLGLPASTIGWGPWLGAGMSSMMNERQGVLGMPPLRAGPALAALERIVWSDSPHVIVADLVWNRFRNIYEASGPRLLLADMEGTPTRRIQPSVRFLQELAGIPSGDREPAVVLWLQRQVAEILGWNDPLEVDPGADYFDLGMDSLTVVELCTQIQCHLRLMISPAGVFEHDNLEGLAHHILALHTQRETHGR